MFGDNVRLPSDVLPPTEEYNSLEDCVKLLKMKLINNKTTATRVESKQSPHIPKELADADYVYIRKDSNNTPLGLLRTGPYKVLDRTNDNVIIQTQHGRETIAWHRTTPAHLGKHVRYNIPRKRGRPRRGEM